MLLDILQVRFKEFHIFLTYLRQGVAIFGENAKVAVYQTLPRGSSSIA